MTGLRRPATVEREATHHSNIASSSACTSYRALTSLHPAQHGPIHACSRRLVHPRGGIACCGRHQALDLRTPIHVCRNPGNDPGPFSPPSAHGRMRIHALCAVTIRPPLASPCKRAINATSRLTRKRSRVSRFAHPAGPALFSASYSPECCRPVHAEGSPSFCPGLCTLGITIDVL
jgi:hypothetical protein